jgi:hypothetical protein
MAARLRGQVIRSAMADLKAVFNALYPLLKRYVPPLVATIDKEDHYELWSKKPAVVLGRKRDQTFFASIVIRRDYVGLYYMPVYTDTDLRALFAPELLKLLKGKSCFYIRKPTPELLTQIASALEKGFERYHQNGWI